MADACGDIFRTIDGGRSWTRESSLPAELRGGRGGVHSTHWLWLDEEVGLVFPLERFRAFRTRDAGASWVRVALPRETPHHFAIEHVGSSLWTCGSTGTLMRSLDQGRSWQLLPGPRYAGDTIPDGWCSGLSFLDEKEGWAIGSRTVWRTGDSAVSWQQLESLPLRPHEEVRRLVLLTPTVAWISTTQDRTLRTTDAGAAWAEVQAPAQNPEVLVRPDGRRLVVQGTPGPDLEHARPALESHRVAVGSKVVAVAGTRIEIYENGRLIRAGPATSPASGNTVLLQGETPGAENRWGWHQEQVFQSSDGGLSWFRGGTLDAPVERIAVVNDKRILLRAGGSLRSSTDRGATWEKTDALDLRADWERITGENQDLAPGDRVDCALRNPARVELHFGVQGCFGGSATQITLQLGTGVARVYGPSGERPIPIAAAHEAIQELSTAASRVEVPSECTSTNRNFARLRWTCADSSEAVMSFETYDCGERTELETVGGMTIWGQPQSGAYARANGVRQWGERLLRRFEVGR